MIKFFRQIRQHLLSEGKTGKYLKYALGEIVLVVIGILIAIQINAFYELRKNEQKMRTNAKLLIQNLEADSLYISNWKKSKDNDLEIITSFEKRLRSPDATIDTLLQIAKNEYRKPINTVEFTRNVVFNTMVASGEINLFDKALIQEIYTVYSNQSFVLKRNDNSFNTYLFHIRNFNERYGSSLITEGPLYEKIWANINEKELITSFGSMAGHKKIYYRQVTSSMEKIESQINHLIGQLQKFEE